MNLDRSIAMLLVAVCMGTTVNAQSYPQELLRYSMSDITGTARSIGAGGAFSTVGADMSNAFSNPAGLGLYRGTEISGGLGFLINNNTTSFLGTQLATQQFQVYAPNVGALLAIPVKRKNKSPNFVQVSVAYQRLADFNTDKSFNALNNYNSQVDGLYKEIMSSGNPVNYDNYSPEAVQAFQTWLFDTIDGGQYFHGPVTQSGLYRERGGSNEIALSVSGNINDKVYIGGGIGIPWVNYNRDINYSESVATPDTIFNVQNYTQQSSYSFTGAGVNLKLGVIVRPYPWWRVGASLATPSYFSSRYTKEQFSIATQSYSPTYNYAYSDTFPPIDQSAPYNFTYSRPLKLTLGTSFYYKQWGLLSIDYELNDYQHTSLNFPGYASDAAYYNNQIKALYGVGHTLRVGVEASPLKELRLRAGYVWNSSPIQSYARAKGYDMQQHTVTTGIGYRGKVFFVDLAYAITMGGNYQSLYKADANEPALLTKYSNHRIVLTLGVKFPSKG